MVTKAVVLKFGNLSLNFIGLFIVEYRFFGYFFETWFFNITLRALQGHIFFWSQQQKYSIKVTKIEFLCLAIEVNRSAICSKYF